MSKAILPSPVVTLNRIAATLMGAESRQALLELKEAAPNLKRGTMKVSDNLIREFFMLRFLLSGVLLGMAATSAYSQALLSGYEQAKPWLGVAIDKGVHGVLVKEVLPDTPAQSAGLQAGDEITAIDATAVKVPDEIIRAVQAKGVGHSVVVHFIHAQKPRAKTVRLVARPDQLKMLRQALVGKPAPSFDLTVMSGKESGKSEALKGKVTLVEFWATWCPACRSTHARLSAYAKQHKDMAVVAISDEETEPLQAYVKKVQPAFTVLQDKAQATQGAWHVAAIPQLVVLDAKGVVAFATVGAGEYLEEALAKMDELAKAK